MHATKPIQLLVLQSTGFCNIDCDYCYLPDRNIRGRMGIEVLNRVAEEVVASDLWRPSSLVLWHAGEPMSTPPDWYANAHAALDRNSGRLRRIQFQSNGTLLDEDWVALLKTSGAGLGLSIDGPQWLHDRHRKDRRGSGTFARVMETVARLREESITFTNIATVTRDSLAVAEDIFAFFSDLAPEKLAFSIEEAEGANSTSTLYREDMLGRIEDFFFKMADLNFRSPAPLRIREVESVIASLIAPEGRLKISQEAELGRIVAIGITGDVALYSPELLTTRRTDGSYATVGNILEQSLAEICAGEAARQQHEEIARGVEMCHANCSYYGYCGGGSPANKYFETNRFDSSETWYCRIAKQATVRGVLRAIAAHSADAPGLQDLHLN